METRASKPASDAETPSTALSATKNLSQIESGPFSSIKIESTTPPSKTDISPLLLSREEMSVVMAMRSQPPTAIKHIPSSSNAFEDFQQPLQVSFTKLDAPTPPNSIPPTAATAPSTPSTPKTDKKAVQKQTGKWDLHDLVKNQFTLSSTLNKPRWEKLDRALKMNSLYTLAVNERVSPTPTEDNRNGYTDEIISLTGPPYDHTPADDVPNYLHDIRRLQQMMYAAFDKALYHQSQGFLNEDPVLMYKDLKNYFYGRDNNGINAARAALTRYKINPAISLKADITIFEETLKNVEYAADEIITENIRLSILDEKFCLDTRLGVRERLTHCQCSFYSYAATMDALKNTPNASVAPGNHSRLNNFQQIKSKDLCNNFLKGKCTYGEKCKYVHADPAKGGKLPTPLKAIADVPHTLPPSAKPTKPKTHARPHYISEAHRIKIGAMTGKITASNPLGISHNQEVILKFLQGRDSEWDMRGGRDSNGNEYGMNMFAASDPSSPLTPKEEPRRNPPPTTLHEYDVDSEDYDYLYSRSPYPFCHIEPDSYRPQEPFGHLFYTPPTPYKPRSAPYVAPEHRDAGYRGYNYDFLRQPEPIQYQQPHVPEQIDESEPALLEEPKEPTRTAKDVKSVIRGDIAEFITKTILVFQHVLPSNAVLPGTLKGYISYVYDEVPIGLTVKDKNVNRSVNIFGWKSISPLHHHCQESLHVYFGDPHLLELLNVLGNAYLHASTVSQHNDTPLSGDSYNSFSPFARTFNHQPSRGSYRSSIVCIHDYVHYFNNAMTLPKYSDIKKYLMLTMIYDFMSFTSEYYRHCLQEKTPLPYRMEKPREKLMSILHTFKTSALVNTDHMIEFHQLIEVFLAIAQNAAPTPCRPTAVDQINFRTPAHHRKRAADVPSAQDEPKDSAFKKRRYSEGHDEASDDEGEAQIVFSPDHQPRPDSMIIDLSMPMYPSAFDPQDLNDVDEVHIDFFSTVSLNAMSSTTTTIIMDSGAGRTGTSDMSLLRNVKPSHTTTVTGAFGPAIKPSHTGTFGPHNLDAVFIKSMGPQTLVSLSQFCNAGNKFIGIFTPTEYRMYDASSAMPALKLLSARGIVAERGTVQNGIYVRS